MGTLQCGQHHEHVGVAGQHLGKATGSDVPRERLVAGSSQERDTESRPVGQHRWLFAEHGTARNARSNPSPESSASRSRAMCLARDGFRGAAASCSRRSGRRVGSSPPGLVAVNSWGGMDDLHDPGRLPVPVRERIGEDLPECVRRVVNEFHLLRAHPDRCMCVISPSIRTPLVVASLHRRGARDPHLPPGAAADQPLSPRMRRRRQR